MRDGTELRATRSPELEQARREEQVADEEYARALRRRRCEGIETAERRLRAATARRRRLEREEPAQS